MVSFRIDWIDPLVVPGTLKGLLQHHNSKLQWYNTVVSVAVANCHNLCGLNKRNVFLHSSGGQKARTKVLAGPLSPQSLRGRSPWPLPAARARARSPRPLPAASAIGSPLHSLACGHIARLNTRFHKPLSSFPRLPVSKFASCKTAASGLSPLRPDMTSTPSYPNYICKEPISK